MRSRDNVIHCVVDSAPYVQRVALWMSRLNRTSDRNILQIGSLRRSGKVGPSVVVCSLMLLFSTIVGYSQASVQPFFLLMADSQMGMFERDANWSQESANLDMAIATANRLHPAFVIICGDLVNKSGNPAEIEAFRLSIAKLNHDIPLHLVAGNHDVGNIPSEASLESYRNRFGSDRYTFQQSGFFGIVLNSSLMGTKGNEKEDADELSWLDQQLTSAEANGVKMQDIAIFQHIPLFLKSADEPDQYFNIPSTSRHSDLDVLHRHGVVHIFAGHYHRNADAVDGQLSMITTGPVGKPLGADGSGLRLVCFRPTWKSLYYELGRLPDSTTFQQAIGCR